MKKNRFINSVKMLVAIAIVSCFSINYAMAQTSVTINVNAKPSGTITGDTTTKVAEINPCPRQAYVYTLNALTNDTKNTTAIVQITQWKIIPSTNATAALTPTTSNDSVSAIFTNAGTASEDVILRAFFQNSITGCSDSASVTIHVIPTPSIVIAKTTSGTNACSESPTDFTGTLTNGTLVSWEVNTNGTGVTFTPDATFGLSSATPKITFVNTGNTPQTVYLKANYTSSTNVGCIYTDSLAVTIEPTPNTSIAQASTSTSGTAILCPDNSHATVATYSLNPATNLSAGVTLGAPVWSLIDTTGKGIYASIDSVSGALAIDSSVNGSVNGSDQTMKVLATYTVNGGSCSGTIYQDTLVVSVHPTPMAKITFAGGSAAQCNGSEITLQVDLTRGNSNDAGWKVEYNDNNTPGHTGVPVPASGTITPATSTTFNVTITSQTDVTFSLKKITDGYGCITNLP